MKRSVWLTALIFLSPTLWGAESFKVGEGARATFEAVGKPSLLKVKGEGAKIVGELKLDAGKASGRFELDLNQFVTGIGLRDRHMKEKYLETDKFPKTVLEVSQVDLPKDFKAGQSAKAVRFKGTLTLKGVSKPITGQLSVNGENMATVAEFEFSLNDYPIGVPSYMGVTIADRVAVRADLPRFVRN